MFVLDKPRLTALARHLHRQQPTLTHTQALDMVAHGLGFGSLNACLAAVKDGPQRASNIPLDPTPSWSGLFEGHHRRNIQIHSMIAQWMPPLTVRSPMLHQAYHHITALWKHWLYRCIDAHAWLGKTLQPDVFLAWINHYAEPILVAWNAGTQPEPSPLSAPVDGQAQVPREVWRAAVEILQFRLGGTGMTQPLSGILIGQNLLAAPMLPPWGIERDLYLERLANFLLPKPLSSDSFWVDNARVALLGIMGYVLAQTECIQHPDWPKHWALLPNTRSPQSAPELVRLACSELLARYIRETDPVSPEKRDPCRVMLWEIVHQIPDLERRLQQTHPLVSLQGAHRELIRLANAPDKTRSSILQTAMMAVEDMIHRPA